MARRVASASSQSFSGTFSSFSNQTKAALIGWLKRANGSSRIGFGSWNRGDRAFWVQLSSDGYVFVNAANGDFTNWGRVANTSTDYVHVAAVLDGSLSGSANRLKVWVNAVQQTLSFGSAGIDNRISALNTGPFEVGYRAEQGLYDNGDFTLLGAWAGSSMSIGQSEIDALYNMTSTPADLTGGLVGAWLCNETGSTDNLSDSSGAGVTLTQSNSPIWVADPDAPGGGGAGAIIIPPHRGFQHLLMR